MITPIGYFDYSDWNTYSVRLRLVANEIRTDGVRSILVVFVSSWALDKCAQNNTIHPLERTGKQRRGLELPLPMVLSVLLSVGVGKLAFCRGENVRLASRSATSYETRVGMTVMHS